MVIATEHSSPRGRRDGLLRAGPAPVWAFAFAGAGYGLGTGYRGFDHSFNYAEYAIVAGIVALLAYLVYRWIGAAKVAPRADDSSR